MMQLINVPLEIFNRALDLYGVERETTIDNAHAVLMSAQSRLDPKDGLPGIAPFAQAVAEYMSLCGPFREDGGEFAGINGYLIIS